MFSHWYCMLLNYTFSLALHHVDGFAKKSALHFHKTFNLMQNSLPDLILYCLPNYIQTYLFVQYRKQLWMFCQKKLKNHFWIVESTVLCLKFAVLIVSQYDIHLQKMQIFFAQILFWTLFYFDNWQFCLIFPLKKSCINSISLDIWQVCPICWWHPLRPDIPQGIPS